MTTQPEALRLAENFDDEIKWQTVPISRDAVAAELRRLHESNQELLAALKKIAGYDLPDETAIVEVACAAIAKAERTTT